MKCPTLKDLPPPPAGKSGWPWTEDCPTAPARTPEGNPWPRLSIVTPSLNQGRFIEETIRSVLLQGYPELEYIVIDGGSNDDTVSILKKYQPWLTTWVSEPDRGQSHAINKGLERATGSFAAYQNSDDIYFPGALVLAGRLLGSGNCDVLFATADRIDEQGRRTPASTPIPEPALASLVRFWRGPSNIFPSQGFFCSLEILRRAGLYRESYHYKMDFDLICRVLQISPRGRIVRTNVVISGYRVYVGTKTGIMSSCRSAAEGLEISRRYWSRLPIAQQREIAREAREGMSFMAMCRAESALLAGQRAAAAQDLMRAWFSHPRMALTRWNGRLVARLAASLVPMRNEAR